MRILIVADKLTGGAGNVAQQLASFFSEKKDNTVFLLIDASAQPKYDLSKVIIIDRRINPVKLKSPIKLINRFIKSSQKLGETINRCNVDVIISFLNSISPEVLFSQWKTKIPVVVSERSNPYMEWSQRGWIDKLKWIISYRRADMIVYQFKAFEPFFKFTYHKGKTCVIPNMIFSDARVPCSQDKEPHDTIRFATLATLYPVKRIDLMIDIFASLLKKHSCIELNIYGNGSDKEKLQQKTIQMGIDDYIHFHGHVQNTYEELCKNDLLLLTSEREGFPNAILDAMEAGLPTIMFKCHGGLSEIIQDGINGFLIKQDDVHGYIDKLDYLINNPGVIADMGKNVETIRKQYNKKNVLGLWDKCIKNVTKH
jgi:glycosyltransferase involved in cell wall biosynthesis